MSTTTPNLTLTLYNSTTDQVVTFATFRAVWGGTATTSNFYRIDTWAGTVNSSITTLQNQKGAIPVSASYVSANYYEATVASITSYITGMTILLKLDTDSAGTVTMNINSLGTKSVTKVNSSGTIVNIAGTELQSNRYYLFTYDGTQWVWVDAQSSDQIVVVGGTSGNVLTVASDGSIDGTLTQSLLLSQTVNAATAKTTLADADNLGITDSAASNVLKKITWANFKTAIGTALGAIINALTGKTTPVGADVIAIGDSASSFASKLVLLSNLYKSLGTGTQDSTTFLRGDGTYDTPAGGGKYEGLLNNGKFEVSVSSNNLVIALKTFAGTDPTTTDPIKIYIQGVERTITSALSITLTAGTNYFNSGSTSMANNEIDYCLYAVWDSNSSAVAIAPSRMYHGRIVSDFSSSSTDEKYLYNYSSFTSTDDVTPIGRFAATLSGGAGYTWSVPTFNSSNLVLVPTYQTRWLSWTPVFTGFSSAPTVIGHFYQIIYDQIFVTMREGVNGTSNSNSFSVSSPFSPKSLTNMVANGMGSGIDNSAGLTSPIRIVAGTGIYDVYYNMVSLTGWTSSGGKRLASGFINYPIG